MEMEGSSRYGAMEVLGCEGWMKREEHQRLVRNWAGSVTLLQVVIVGGMYLLAPGYIIPFLNHPVARIVMLIASTWSLFGWTMLWTVRIKNRWAFELCATAVVVFFSLPLLFIPLIGPATIGIMQALGPIWACK